MSQHEHNSASRKLCGVNYHDEQQNKPMDCQRIVGHDGDHDGLVEYRAIKHHPWLQVLDNVARKAKEGAFCFQSWTCNGCGAVQRMAQVNGFYDEGVCENCGHVTNLIKKGCNFTLMMPLAGATREQMRQFVQSVGFKPPRDN